MLKTLLRWVALAAVVLSGLWAFREPKIEAWVAVATSIAAFLGTFLPFDKSGVGQRQSVKSGSIGVQAGGNVSGDIGNKDV